MDIWKHGRFVDLWSLVHLLSGFLLAVGFFGLGYGFEFALVLSVVLLSAWEVFEWAIRIIETQANIVIDLAIGLVGFLMGAYWHYFLGHPFNTWSFSILLASTLCLALWGFIDFHFKGYR